MMRTTFRLLAKKMKPPVYFNLTQPIMLVGYGSIGRGFLPLLERHFNFKKDQVAILDPVLSGHEKKLRKRGYKKLMNKPMTRDNYTSILSDYFKGKGSGAGKGDGADHSVQGIVVNLSIDVDSIDVARMCNELNLLYIDTVVEPWFGAYFNRKLNNSERSNYMKRERLLEEKRSRGSNLGMTAVSCCGANPGMVTWFVKDALLQIGNKLRPEHPLIKNPPDNLDANAWATLMRDVGVKGVHIAERDTQIAKKPKVIGEFRNTWSSDGIIAEGLQPAELGWGTHEKWMPPNGFHHPTGCQAAIYLEQPGANTRVRTWCPTHGPQQGFLVTHNESISLADYFTVGEGKTPEYRPTVHYSYLPCADAVQSFFELFGNNCLPPKKEIVLKEDEILPGGFDELGVLLYGHEANAYWYGSTLTNEECLRLVGEQNCTGLQVSSAALAGLVWALSNPHQGIVEAEQMDWKRCLEVQRPYLGKVWGKYTDWTPLKAILREEKNLIMFDPPKRTDLNDPWQFSNVLIG